MGIAVVGVVVNETVNASWPPPYVLGASSAEPDTPLSEQPQITSARLPTPANHVSAFMRV